VSSIWTPEGDRPLPTPEDQELADELAAMQEELAGVPASVVIINHAVGLFQLAAIHLNRQPPNLADGRLAIDALAALVNGVGNQLGEEAEALRQALTQLRMAYVSLSAPPD
jgi:hypothetical protein